MKRDTDLSAMIDRLYRETEAPWWRIWAFAGVSIAIAVGIAFYWGAWS